MVELTSRKLLERTAKEKYLAAYREWRENHYADCMSEAELSIEWDRMKPKQKEFALRNIIETVIIANAAKRAGGSRTP